MCLLLGMLLGVGRVRPALCGTIAHFRGLLSENPRRCLGAVAERRQPAERRAHLRRDPRRPPVGPEAGQRHPALRPGRSSSRQTSCSITSRAPPGRRRPGSSRQVDPRAAPAPGSSTSTSRTAKITPWRSRSAVWLSPSRQQRLGPRPLDELQVVGVVDDAAGVGVLPVDPQPELEAHAPGCRIASTCAAGVDLAGMHPLAAGAAVVGHRRRSPLPVGVSPGPEPPPPRPAGLPTCAATAAAQAAPAPLRVRLHRRRRLRRAAGKHQRRPSEMPHRPLPPDSTPAILPPPPRPRYPSPALTFAAGRQFIPTNSIPFPYRFQTRGNRRKPLRSSGILPQKTLPSGFVNARPIQPRAPVQAIARRSSAVPSRRYGRPCASTTRSGRQRSMVSTAARTCRRRPT